MKIKSSVLTGVALALCAGAFILAARRAGAPVVAVSPQPAQRQRDAGLASWLDLQTQQERVSADAVRRSWAGDLFKF